jgi:hypothetical protein
MTTVKAKIFSESCLCWCKKYKHVQDKLLKYETQRYYQPVLLASYHAVVGMQMTIGSPNCLDK